MKKIFSIISAGLMLLVASSCVKDELAVVDTSTAVAPVLGSYEVGAKKVTAEYTPGSFKMGFNENMKVNHSIVLVSAGGNSVSKILASGADGKVSVSNATISKALTALGYNYDETVAIELAIRASLQDPTKDNGRNGFVDSKDKIQIASFLVEAPAANPFEGFTKESPWGVTGSITAAGISWDKDIEMVSDGTWHVAKSVVLAASDQFKFRKDGGWDVNVGATGDVEPFIVALDEEIAGAQGGKNLAVATDGVYDLWVNGDTNAYKVTEAYNPYPDYKETSAWTIIGALSSYGISWDGDIETLSDGKGSHVAQGIRIVAGDQFKFRKDQAWTENFGAAGDTEPFVVTLDAAVAATQDGKNLAVPADGVYDLILNEEAKTITVVETLGGPASKKLGGDEPDPEPPTFTGWSLIGTINGTGWDTDFDMDEVESGVFYINGVSIAADSEFKIRKDHDWSISYGTAGDAAVVLDMAFPATTDNGGNIKLGSEAKVDITLNTNDNTILIATHKGLYSLIGNIEGTAWNKDFNMTEQDGKWVINAIQIDGEFKVRYDASWDDDKCYGVADGQEYGLGAAFELCQPGANINVGEGSYNVTFDPESKTLLVENAAKSWGVIGDFCGWGEDVDMTELMPGIWVSPVLDLAGGWKIRFDNGWDINRGGAALSAQGAFVEAVQNGDNLGLEGSFKVVYNANNETIGTLGFGVTGSIASCGINWDNDIPMNLASDGKFYSLPVALTTADQLKVRWNAAWDINRGGKCDAADAEFDAVGNGDNITVPADGTYMVVFDPTTEKLTISTQFWGLIGDFNGWGGDTFMLALGEGKWAAYNQTMVGGWKCRMSSDWAVNFGGVYGSLGTAFPVNQNGDNISCAEENIDIVLDTVAATITISK